MLVASNKYDQDMFSNVIDKKWVWRDLFSYCLFTLYNY